MTQVPQQQQPRFSPERKVNVWAFVRRCVEKSGQDERTSDAMYLVNQQLRAATDEGGKR